jgi:putative DNA primase/helicase
MAVARMSKGTTEGWQDTVAKPALYSSPMVVAIAAVFAAPFLGPMDIDSFIAYLAGRTSGGKTTNLLPVASAIGIGKKSLLPTWKNTEAGLELQAHQEYADMAFPIDELAHVGSEADVFKKIDAVAYMFDAGVNKKMHDRAGSAVSRRPRRVTGSRAIVITSYERTLTEIETIVGNQFRPGVRVRVLEIPMSVTKDAEGIFDKLPKQAGKGDQSTKFANRLTKDLRRACAKNSGYVFIGYIKKIVADLTEAKKFVRVRMDWFMEHTKFDRSKGEGYRRAEHFAFLYGAGAYAIELGFLPWSRKQLLDAIRACYRASRASVAAAAPDLAVAPADPVATLEAKLHEHLRDAKRVVPWPKRGDAANDGPGIDGWKQQEGDYTHYRIKTSAINRWFHSAVVDKAVLAADKNARRATQRVPGGDARISVYDFHIPNEMS